MEDEKWYTTREVGEIFGVTMYRISHYWLPIGRFPNARRNAKGRWLIPESDIRACAETLPAPTKRTRRPRKQVRDDAYFRRYRNDRS